MTTPIALLGLGFSGAGISLPPVFPTRVDAFWTAALMLAFYAFGEWAHRRRLACGRDKIVPFSLPGPSDENVTRYSSRSR